MIDFSIPLADEQAGADTDSVEDSMRELMGAHKALLACKDRISSFFLVHKWDFYKKYANAYELIYSPSFRGSNPGISLYRPVSRSFFKLWEILHDFEQRLEMRRCEPVRAAFLAEGPGGFIEAFAKYRAEGGVGEGDEYHGITLISRGSRNVPGWRIAAVRRALADAGKILIHTGADGTGNLYCTANIDHFVLSAGGIGSADIVTADGGFDFSRDFNTQEERALQLVAAQLCTGLLLQAPGGSLILKIYDIHTPAIVHILFLARLSYRDMHIVKPLTSRPANSEKYVVCIGFTGSDRLTNSMRQVCDELLRTNVHEHEQRILSVLGNLSEEGVRFPKFVAALAHANAEMVRTQTREIDKVIDLITLKEGGESTIKEMVAASLRSSVDWCTQYNIPYTTADE